MIILGSGSDYKISEKSVKVLDEMKVPYDIKVASAHRTPGRVKDIMTNYTDNVEVFINLSSIFFLRNCLLVSIRISWNC